MVLEIEDVLTTRDSSVSFYSGEKVCLLVHEQTGTVFVKMEEHSIATNIFPSAFSVLNLSPQDLTNMDLEDLNGNKFQYIETVKLHSQKYHIPANTSIKQILVAIPDGNGSISSIANYRQLI